MIKTAIILCGGLGTRLRPLTNNIPKSLLDIQGKPILGHIFDFLKKYEVENVILSVGFLQDKIREYVNANKFPLNISIIEEKEQMGTGGALRLLSRHYKPLGPVIVSNGDELKDFDIHEMYRIHKENKSIATIALTSVEEPSRYGVVRMEGSKILEFIEKPKDPPSNLINAGFYIIEPEVLTMFPEGFSMIEKDVFPKIATLGRLYGYPFKGQWFDTGTMERLDRAIKNWKSI